MKYIDMKEPGGPDVLICAERPEPVPGPGEVLIRVAAAGVNGPDLLQRKGKYPPPHGASPILGLEVAGKIAATGAGVTGWSPGDKVCALVPGGGYAELVKTPVECCLPVPEGLSLTDAAALPETFFTVWFNLNDRGHLKAGESLLIHGGSSGIGTTAIQLAKAMGAKVFVTVGSEDKARACASFGADHVVNYREQDFVQEIDRLTDGNGVDVILDMVGGDYIGRDLQALANDGRLLSIAMLGGAKAEVDIMPFMVKRLTWSGSTIRAQSTASKGRIAASLRETVWPWLASGSVKPVIFTTFPLSEAADAHRLMEGGQHIGKVVLTVQGT
ncbi:MAG: NAD(P)H-quinone oxidoreductase [Oceanospirillaceae bacterium]|nr:NAD(P)H-quinone oxidoreductase [Oceanospirillaceae bacterium]